MLHWQIATCVQVLEGKWGADAVLLLLEGAWGMNRVCLTSIFLMDKFSIAHLEECMSVFSCFSAFSFRKPHRRRSRLFAFKPLILTLDSFRFKQIVKGGDDPRCDAVTSQLFEVMGWVLSMISWHDEVDDRLQRAHSCTKCWVHTLNYGDDSDHDRGVLQWYCNFSMLPMMMMMMLMLSGFQLFLSWASAENGHNDNFWMSFQCGIQSNRQEFEGQWWDCCCLPRFFLTWSLSCRTLMW